jgi:protein tyrosine/serine phosphatase
VRIQTSAWNPDEAPLILLLKTLQNPDNWPVFVHCAQGRDRTGYSVAVYRMVVENWPVDDALHEMFDFRSNRIWFRNPAFLRQLNIEGMRRLISLAP